MCAGYDACSPLRNLRAQLKELNDAFAEQGGQKIKPTRWLRSDKRPEPVVGGEGGATEAGEGGVDDEEDGDEPDGVDPYDIAEAEDGISKVLPCPR